MLHVSFNSIQIDADAAGCTVHSYVHRTSHMNDSMHKTFETTNRIMMTEVGIVLLPAAVGVVMEQVHEKRTFYLLSLSASLLVRLSLPITSRGE